MSVTDSLAAAATVWICAQFVPGAGSTL